MDEALNSEIKQRFISVVGEKYAITEADEIAPHLIEWRNRWTGKTSLVLKPGTVEEVSAVIRLAHETGTPIVPQGGNTGLVGGQIPDGSGRSIIVSLQRLNRVRAVDVAGDTITVESGATLQAIKDCASENDRFFPLSLASQGSCQIGGNLSTNAGGTGALAYGVARDLCLGLEVVLPNGEILHDLSTLKKDNTGYALRHLFIGAEGTLGIITAATLKLFPNPKSLATALVACDSPEDALALFGRLTGALGSTLTTFELMARIGVQFALEHAGDLQEPFQDAPKWYALVELSSLESGDVASAKLQAILADAFEAGQISDAAIAQSEQQRFEFWRLRELISESQRPQGASIKHDISVPVAAIPEFIAAADAQVHTIEPDARLCTFGHMGDGNLHYNVSQPKGSDRPSFEAKAEEITRAVHATVLDFDGSISAEHGIGQMKVDELADVKSPVALNLMRTIKRSLDPRGIMNPGKVVRSD